MLHIYFLLTGQLSPARSKLTQAGSENMLENDADEISENEPNWTFSWHEKRRTAASGDGSLWVCHH